MERSKYRQEEDGRIKSESRLTRDLREAQASAVWPEFDRDELLGKQPRSQLEEGQSERNCIQVLQQFLRV